MRFTKARNVRVNLPKSALEVVFGECDRYDADETGGRILGTYEQRDGKLFITVSGIIEPGPGATRSAVSFFQDGDLFMDTGCLLPQPLKLVMDLRNILSMLKRALFQPYFFLI